MYVLGSFVLTCMVLSFLQQRKLLFESIALLPPSSTTTTTHPHNNSSSNNSSNSNSNNDIHTSSPMTNLGLLLVEFLHYYGQSFNYFHTGICLLPLPYGRLFRKRERKGDWYNSSRYIHCANI